MSPKKDSVFISWIEEAAQQKGHNMSEAAEAMGISRSYLSELRGGNPNKLLGMQRPAIEAVCAYTKRSYVDAQIALGQLAIKDFQKPNESIKDKAGAAIKYIAQNADWMEIVSTNALEFPIEAQIALIRAYEKVEGGKMLPEFNTAELTRLVKESE